MAYRIVSRRHFIEESIPGSLAFGLGVGVRTARSRPLGNNTWH